MTFLLFTVFSSLRIVSYLPQIRRVVLDGNGATAISYSTWGLWTGANIATALYAAFNLHDLYLSAVSAIYAICCIVVILLTMLKRQRLGIISVGGDKALAFPVDPVRNGPGDALRATVQHAAAALTANRRPHYAFEQDLAARSRRLLWHDLATGVASINPISRGKMHSEQSLAARVQDRTALRVLRRARRQRRNRGGVQRSAQCACMHAGPSPTRARAGEN